MANVFVALFLILSAPAVAAGGEGIPVGSIIVQAVNVLIFIGLMIFFVRPKMRAFFEDRRKAYDLAVNQAQALRQKADQEKREIEEKIANFQRLNTAELERAKQEAEALKQSMLAQGENLAANIRKEAAQAAENELNKAKQELRAMILQQALETSRNKFSELSSLDHKKMNQQFLDNLGAN